MRIATFEVDATPPLGMPIAYGSAKEIVDRLSCRGVVLLTDRQPIVLCAVDWIGIANGGHDTWRRVLAEAAGTSPDRVAVHCLHQHDAPRCDFDADLILSALGAEGGQDYTRDTLRRAARAVQQAVQKPVRVTHLGTGKGKVEKVASNRRVLGADGKVLFVRYSRVTNPEMHAAPEGIIDPDVRMLSFWDGDRPLAALSYYTTHPMSYYGQGGVSCDFVGIGRRLREAKLPGVLHVHFNGAGGNVTAGKYNDGAPENRPVLAQRIADGMAAAWADTKRVPIQAVDVEWRVHPVALPPAAHLDEKDLTEKLKVKPTTGLASNLAWLRRCKNGHEIPLTCLKIGPARVLHMPGELFVEYQLAAQQMRPDLFVAMAAYGDYGPGYIGTRIAYPQGGYEVGPPSRVAPEVEDVLTAGLRTLLEAPEHVQVTPSDITRQAPRLDKVKR